MLIQNCQLEPQRLGVLAELMTGCDFQGTGGEWPGHFLSTRTVTYSCGRFVRTGEDGPHAHDSTELARCQRLASEAAQKMQNVPLITWGDESDHTLSPLFIVANVGDPVPTAITEAVFRAFFRKTIYPGAIIEIEPFAENTAWFARVFQNETGYWGAPDDPDALANEQERIDKWRQFFDWFRTHPDLHSPVYLGFKEPQQTFTSVYPKFFVALTKAGSLVGLATCVVWS